jgi:hypothetical protein
LRVYIFGNDIGSILFCSAVWELGFVHTSVK